jgi:hypothetical protein
LVFSLFISSSSSGMLPEQEAVMLRDPGDEQRIRRLLGQCGKHWFGRVVATKEGRYGWVWNVVVRGKADWASKIKTWWQSWECGGEGGYLFVKLEMELLSRLCCALLTSLELKIPRNPLPLPRSQIWNMNFLNTPIYFYHQYMSLTPHFKTVEKYNMFSFFTFRFSHLKIYSSKVHQLHNFVL